MTTIYGGFLSNQPLQNQFQLGKIMSLDLSPYAIHRIFYFLENDDRRGQKEKKTPAEEHPRKVSDKWDYVYERYFVSSRPPPPEKLRSLEVALLLTDNENAMQAVFEHIKPIEFDQDHPIMLLHEIVDVRVAN